MLFHTYSVAKRQNVGENYSTKPFCILNSCITYTTPPLSFLVVLLPAREAESSRCLLVKWASFQLSPKARAKNGQNSAMACRTFRTPKLRSFAVENSGVSLAPSLPRIYSTRSSTQMKRHGCLEGYSRYSADYSLEKRKTSRFLQWCLRGSNSLLEIRIPNLLRVWRSYLCSAFCISSVTSRQEANLTSSSLMRVSGTSRSSQKHCYFALLRYRR